MRGFLNYADSIDIKFLIFTTFFIFVAKNLFAENLLKSEKIVELSILDKVSSKNTNIILKIGEEYPFQNLNIKVLKCYNSKFDDDPEVTAFLQVTDKTIINGQLTLLGITKPLILTGKINKTAKYPFGGIIKPYVMGISARGVIKRSDHGMMYAIKDNLVGDEIELIIEFEARRQ